MSPKDKPLVWLHGEVRTPPLSAAVRVEAGFLLRQLRHGVRLGMPHSHPMPLRGFRCHERRIYNAATTGRVVYRADPDAVVIAEVFNKQTQWTPQSVVVDCRRRLKEYDNA